MKRLIGAMVALGLSTSAMAAPDPTKLPAALSAEERQADSALPAQVALGQHGIVTAIDAFRGGQVLLQGERTNSAGYAASEAGTLIAMAAREANVTIGPLRKALDGFDADEQAIAAVRSGLSRSSWLKPARIEIAREPTLAGRTAFVAAGPGKKAVLVDVAYYLSADFNQIEAVANLGFARDGKTQPTYFSYHRLTSIVQLPHPSFDPRANVRSWSADRAALARAGLAAAFSRLEDLVGLATEMTPQEVQQLAAKDIAKTYAAGRYGPPVARAAKPGMTTIWARGLVSVQQLADPGPAR